MEKISYHDFPNCVRLANDQVELIILADVGPRIIRFGYLNRQNELYEDPKLQWSPNSAAYHSYGGHRLWHAPEVPHRTTIPDNRPVAVEKTSDGIRFLPPAEEETAVQKEFFVWLDPKSSHVRVLHRMTNIGLWPISLAPWAITVMASGGVGVIPLPPRLPHSEKLLPTGQLALWSYTDMSDPRWHWGKKYILLRQDAHGNHEQKIGSQVAAGWIGYANHGHFFLKCAQYLPEKNYPDSGSNVEMYTDEKILEVETLGPLEMLEPAQSVDHQEDWFLYDGVRAPQNDDDIDREVLPKVEKAKGIVSQSASSTKP
jgi:hypothetical protein